MKKILSQIAVRYFQLNHIKDDTPVLRHNLKMHIIDGLIFMFSMSLVSIQTVIPVFVQQMGGSSIAIGSTQVLWAIGLSLPQLLFLNLYQHSSKIKPALLKYGFIHRLTFFVMGLFSFFLVGKISKDLSVSIFLIIFFAGAITGSMAIPPWYHLFSKTTPVKLRGRLLAIRQLIGSLLGVIGGYFISFVLASINFPINFSILFLTAFLFMMISFFFLFKLIEIESESNSFINNSQNNFDNAKKILKQNKNFRYYLIADSFQLSALTSISFFIVYGLKKFSLPASYAGIYTTISMASIVVSNIFFGYLADKFGHKINLTILSVSILLANIIAIFSSTSISFGAVFFFVACSVGLQGISRLSFVTELCNEAERTLYIAVHNTITAPAIFFGIFAGWLISILDYEIVFFIYSIIALMSFLWLITKVKEPRNINKNY